MLFSCEKEKTTPPQAEGEQAEAIVALNANGVRRLLSDRARRRFRHDLQQDHRRGRRR